MMTKLVSKVYYCMLAVLLTGSVTGLQAEENTPAKSPACLKEMYSLINGEAQSDYQGLITQKLLDAAKKGCPEAQYIAGVMYIQGNKLEANQSEALKYLEQSLANKFYESAVALGDFYKAAGDLETAIDYYEIAADNDNSNGLWKMGIAFLNGCGVKADEAKAVEYLNKAVALNNTDAMITLGKYLYNKKNYGNAADLFGRASGLGNTKALYYQALTAFALNKNADGIKYLNLGVKAEDDKAQCLLGKMYLIGDKVEPNFNEAKHLLELSAKADNPEAQYYMAAILSKATKRGQIAKDAATYAKLSADAGNSFGEYILAIFYEQGIGVEQSDKAAFEFMSRAAAQNNPLAQAQLGDYYLKGLGTAKDSAKGIALLEQASTSDNQNAVKLAKFLLGKYYFDGKEVARDVLKAHKYLTESAEFGYPRAIFTLGLMHKDNTLNTEFMLGKAVTATSDSGFVGKQDFDKMLDFFNKGAELNNQDSLAWLGIAYLHGVAVKNADGVETVYLKKDTAKALEYLRKAEQFNHDEAYFYLGFMYENGIQVAKNLDTALAYYRKAEKLEYPEAYAKLARMYLDGIGVNVDLTRAYEYAKDGAALGNSKAMYLAGYMLDKGLGVDKNAVEAIKYYQQAADLGDAAALYVIGMCYENGRVLATDSVKAYNYYRQAAAMEHANAMFMLGRCYENGIGVARDSYEAKYWYRKAKDNGITYAGELLDKLEQKIK